MTTRDHITGTELVTQYRYHDGYFDGREREFRGFGLVEQIDAAAAPGPDDADGAPPPSSPERGSTSALTSMGPN